VADGSGTAKLKSMKCEDMKYQSAEMKVLSTEFSEIPTSGFSFTVGFKL
jgi:hypothetical protein